FPVLILLKAARAERDRVVKLNACADLRRFTDDYTGAVVDKKMGADFCTGMNIDSGTAVSPLGHDARNQGHLAIKQVRHSMDSDCLQRGISENNFFVTPRSRIAFVGGIDVCPKNSPHCREFP